MGLRINSNIEALNAHRNLLATSNMLSKSMEKLSSGLRINRAADDAAGLAISEKLISQIKGLSQAIRNAQDGISLIQTAEGGLNETHSVLQRMRELAVQAANETLSDEDRQLIQLEVEQLLGEIDRIAQTTKFNNTTLLDGTRAAITLHVGPGSSDQLDVSLVDADVAALTLTGLSVGTVGGALSAIVSIDDAIQAISSARATLGAVQNRLEHTVANLSVAAENLQAANSRIRDTDMAQEMMNFTRLQILQQAGTAMLAQANLSPQAVLKLLG